MSQALARVRNAARQRKKQKFTALFHYLDLTMFRTALFALKRDAAPGVDGLTWQDYEGDLDRRIEFQHARVHGASYRALPSRRRYIPKSDGKQRPLAVAALEYKIVQRATAAVLNAIYEEDFLGFQKWLKAASLKMEWSRADERETEQGSVASPLLANIYLHYVLDLWAARWRRRETTGDMIIVRYADVIVIGFDA